MQEELSDLYTEFPKFGGREKSPPGGQIRGGLLEERGRLRFGQTLKTEWLHGRALWTEDKGRFVYSAC